MTLPNQLTLLRILLTPVFVFLLFIDATWAKIGAFVVFTIAALTDWYDGYAARKLGGITMWGQFLDPLADKILVSSGFICFSVIGYIPAWMVMVIVIRDFLITIFRSYAIIKSKPIQTSYFAKVKTFIQFGIIYFIFIYHLIVWENVEVALQNKFLGITTSGYILIIMWLVIVLTVISALDYFLRNKEQFHIFGEYLSRVFRLSDKKREL